MSFVSIVVVCCLSAVAVPVAEESTSLWDTFQIRLLPGFKNVQQQGFDSLPGKLVHDDGREVFYEIGLYYPPGEPRTGGAFENAALKAAASDGTKLKVQTIGGQTFYVAQSTDGLTISTVWKRQGINFGTRAATPADVADVLLMVLSLTPKQLDVKNSPPVETDGPQPPAPVVEPPSAKSLKPRGK